MASFCCHDRDSSATWVADVDLLSVSSVNSQGCRFLATRLELSGSARNKKTCRHTHSHTRTHSHTHTHAEGSALIRLESIPRIRPSTASAAAAAATAGVSVVAAPVQIDPAVRPVFE